MTQTRKAIALLSGGLDSSLAARIIKDQGVEVIGLHLLSPFGCRTEIEKNAEALGVPIIFKEKGPSYLDLVENPRYGYGANMNPCIDCRIFMFQLADVVRQDEKADFIVTGEVLGQRPMSQRRDSMNTIDRNSPLDGLVLRPLSARALAPTLPEQEGWVDREKLFKIVGRGRKDQLKLADEYDLKDYASPGGGCLLTESGFTPKLQDFFKYPHHQSEGERMVQSQLLRLGRHFRFSPHCKVILGRDEKENREMAEFWRKAGGAFVNPDNFDGPAAIVLGEFSDQTQQLAGALISRYGKSHLVSDHRMKFENKDETGFFIVASKVAEEELQGYRL